MSKRYDALDAAVALADTDGIIVAQSNVLKRTTIAVLLSLLSLTKSDVGLANVDNTADADKPISDATATALAGKQASLGFTPENSVNKNVANGYCGLDASGFIDPSRLPGTVKGIRTPTGTTDQFVLADAGKIVEFNNASPIAATVPDNATVAFPVGTVIHCAQVGAGQVTFVAGGSTVIRSDTSKLKTSGQWTTCFIYKRATDEWVLSGNIAA